MRPAAVPIQTEADPVDALIKSIRIPPRPRLLMDLQQELNAAEPSPAAIGRIVARDVGMSGALLKLANSSFYGGKRKAKSVEQAILFLGINQVAALMTGLLARQAIGGDNPTLAQFWEVSARRAQAMLFLARRLRLGEPDVAHTFGLFCDTGIPLLLDRFPDYAVTLAEAAQDRLRPVTALEDERHSTNHAAIGCLLARNWGLPADVAWAILHHQDYSVLDDTATSDAIRQLVALSVLADSAIAQFQANPSTLEWDKGGSRACGYLGLSWDETADLMDELHDCFHADH